MQTPLDSLHHLTEKKEKVMARRKNGGSAKEKIGAKQSGAARRGGARGARHTGARAKRSLISRLKFW